MSLQTLHDLVGCLPAYGSRRAVGLRQDIGLRWWSYRRLYDEAYRVAALLRARGIQPGDRLLLWAPNCPEWAGFFLGAALRGVVVVPADEGATPGAVRRMAEATEAALLVHGPEQDASGVRVPTQSIFAPGSECEAPLDEGLAVPVDPDDPAVILYTSGTTTQQRGVILTHGNLVAQTERFRGFRGLVRVIPTRMLMLSPLSHSQGLLLGICLPFFVGVSVIYSHSVDPAHVMRTIKQNRVTLLVAVPRVQHLLAKALQQMPVGRRGLTLAERIEEIRSPFWRRRVLFHYTRSVLGYLFWALLVGGATLPPEDAEFWYESRYFLAHGYGLTETAAIVSFHLTTPFSRPRGSVGKPLADQTVHIAEDGEILVRGPSVTSGYLGDRAADAEVFVDEDGFLHTGDLAHRDAKGRLYFRGRKKEIIVTGEGFNVFPDEVEAVLRRMPGVRDAAVVGSTPEEHEEVHAALLLEDGAQPSSIIQEANAALEPHQRIRSWTVWPEGDFPRGDLLKVRREQVAAAIREAQGRASPEPAAAERTISLDMIRSSADRRRRLQLIAEYLAGRQPRHLASLDLRLVHDLGLSSLDVIELLSLLERRGAVPWKAPILGEDTTLADLHALVGGSEPPPEASAMYTKLPPPMDHPLVRAAHAFLAPLVLPAWFSYCARLVVQGSEHLADLRPPFLVVGAHHEHGIDAMAIYCALPRRLRGGLLLVTTQWVFLDYLEPTSQATLAERVRTALSFYVGMPVLLPFVLWPQFGTTREGLMETCRLIDRGFSPIVFPAGEPTPEGYAVQPGVGLVAVQTQVPILPLRLAGNDGIDFRSRRRDRQVTVRFGRPIRTTATTIEQVTAMIQEAFRTL